MLNVSVSWKEARLYLLKRIAFNARREPAAARPRPRPRPAPTPYPPHPTHTRALLDEGDICG
jgi:hypothetical protein